MMTATADHRWSRLDYPLQAASKVSVMEAPVASPEIDVHDCPSDRLPMAQWKSDDPVVRYEAGPEESPSRRASGVAEYTSVSIHSPTMSHPLNVVPGIWTRHMHPSGVVETAIDHAATTSETAMEEEMERSPSRSTSPSSVRRERTLRRIPRSRQIDLRTQAMITQQAAAKLQLNGGEQETATVAASPWRRETYPLQSTTSSSSTQTSPSLSDEEYSGLEYRPPLCQRGDESQSSADSDWANGIDLQEHKGGTLTDPTTSLLPLSGDSDKANATATQQTHNSSDAGREGNLWHGQRYPLQAPASRTKLQAHSPPSSCSGDEDQDQSLVHRPQNNSGSADESKKWHRNAYPLQAPSGASNLMPQVRPQSSHLETEETDEKVTIEPQKPDVSGQKQKRHRKVYPLQSPASIPKLQYQETQPLAHGGIENLHEVVPPQPQTTSVPKQSGMWQRKTYPLQAPASKANLREQWLTAPPSPERSQEHAPFVSVEQIREHYDSPPRAAAFRRQNYPLQAPASGVDSRITSAPAAPVEGEVPGPLAPLEDPSRKYELATAVVNQWRRQSYPRQSHDGSSRFYRSQTPQPPEEEAEEPREPRPIHLPRNIPAVKDAGNYDSRGRTIVVCLDGTGDKFDNDNSNIVHLISALKKDDARQVTYYQAGVGTYGAGGLSGGVTAAMDMAVGSSLGLHVRGAYHFLMHSYKEGDKICIFGFSRGAYTARCLAGMIHKVGLLPPRNIQQISFAYQFYTDDTPEGWKQSHDFKKTFCIDISVYFLGCFDSVASVGFIPRQLPLSSTPTNKAWFFRHAMALDERRAKFKVCRHQTKDFDDIKAQDDSDPANCSETKYGKSTHHLTDEEHERLEGGDIPFDSDVLEVWFAGAHADIGGGAVPNVERHKLAQIPLRWMIRQAFECNTGIIFKTAVLAEHGLDVHTLWPKYQRLSAPAQKPPPLLLERYKQALPPRSVRRSKLVPTDRFEKGEQFLHLKSHTDEDWTPEQVEDFYDALSPLNDQLVQAPSWWILELLPVEYIVPISPNKSTTTVGMNLGRYRALGHNEPKVHWTALHRAQHNGYRIQARVAPGTIWRTAV